MDKNEEPDFLPNVGNEMTGEQIKLHNKVKKINEKLSTIYSHVIKWYKSPGDNKCYPKHVMNNKSAYRRWAKKYCYYETKEILYKVTLASDGIGEY